MKNKTLILMVVAIVCGLAAAYMTNQLLAQRDQTIKVLVAKQKMSQWTQLKDPPTLFEEQDWPKDKAPEKYVKSHAELRNRTLLKNLESGQVVTDDDLMGKDRSGLETYITPGMLAFAIKVSPETSVGGFVQPNSHVNVIHTIKKGDKTEAKIILEDILVRAVDLTPERPQDRPGAAPATVTLEVTPEDALILAKAVETGQIKLALRPALDNGKKLVETKKPEEPPPVEKKPAPVQVAEAPKPPPVKVSRMLIVNSGRAVEVRHIEQDGQIYTEQGRYAFEPPPPPAPKPPQPQPQPQPAESETVPAPASKPPAANPAAPKLPNPTHSD